MGQKLRGFVGQGMSGQRRSLTPVVYSYPSGSYTFTATKNGIYRFVVWGAGSGGNTGVSAGASGAFIIAERPMTKGQTAALSIGRGGNVVTDGGNTTVTFAGTGEVLTAGGGLTAGTGGTATAGFLDRAINGSAPGVAGGGDNGGTSGAGQGGGSPGYGTYRGGNGGSSGLIPQQGGGSFTTSQNINGGDGAVLVHQIRMRP